MDQTATSTPAPAFTTLAASYLRAKRAENRSRRTLDTYSGNLRRFGAFLASRGMPTDPTAITREHVETYMTWLLTEPRTNKRGEQAKRSAQTVVDYFITVQLWFTWLVAEGELTRSPMERMKAPKVVDRPPNVLSADELRALLKACEGRDFFAKRDLALIRVLIDTGARLGELLGMTTAAIDWERQVIRVLGKGSKPRDLPFGDKTAADLDRYLRERVRHPQAAISALWLARGGAISDAGVDHILRHRAGLAGIEGLHPHTFRHTWSDNFLESGGQEHDLATLAGWTSTRMAGVYGRKRKTERAISAYRTLRSPGDRL